MENEIYGRIYLITNLINGKQYIGKTTQTIKKRFVGHCSDAKIEENSCMIVVRSIKKYGKENFKIEEIDIAYSSEELKLLEGFYIKKYNTLSPNGYNLTDIINGYSKHSKETIEKMKISVNKPERLKLSSEQGKNHRGKIVNGSKSKYIGVCMDKNKYAAKIKFNYKTIFLGNYNTEINAAKAYDIAAIKYFGDHVIINFPESRQDYISDKITINKNTHQDKSRSGIKGIVFNKSHNKWVYRWFDKKLNKNRSKYFEKLENAVKYKEEL